MSTNSQLSAADWNSFARKQAHERWRRQSAIMGSELTRLVVREADVQAGMDVLDVACGSGEPAISVASLLNGTGHIVGTDISPEPLEVARQRAEQRGLGNLDFQHADVASLPFPDESFDRVTCRLGLMYFPDVSKALGEIRRVMRPGGRFTAATWGPMTQPYFDLTVGTLRRLMPELSIPGSAQQIFRFGDPSTVSEMLSAAGFTNVRVALQSVPWNWEGSPQELWQYFQAVTVPFTPLFQQIPPARKPDLDSAVEAELALRYDGTRVEFKAQFTVATAHKP